MNKNMTALVSLFARVYHTKNSNIKMYNDIYGERILTKEEYISIYNSMKQGIKYFNKDFTGDNPVEYIVNNNLAPSVLARSIYNEDKLQREIAKELGISQQYYSQYELGHFTIPVELLIKLADMYNVSIDYITERTNNKKLSK